MATKKKALSPAECDRWDTIPGTTKTVGKNTPAQQKAVDEINAMRAKAAKAAKGPKKKK